MVIATHIASKQNDERVNQERASWRTLDHLLNWLQTIDTNTVDRKWLFAQLMEMRPATILGPDRAS